MITRRLLIPALLMLALFLSGCGRVQAYCLDTAKSLKQVPVDQGRMIRCLANDFESDLNQLFR